MEKSDYITPDEEWLLKEFQNIPFGIVRPAEMEIILGFFIIYHNGSDIEKPESFLAQKYKISENKARRFKIEFAARYRKEPGADQITGALSRLFDTSKKNVFELNEAAKTISFTIKDPWDLKIIKENMVDNRIVYRGDFNGTLISLSLEQFMRFMALHYTNLSTFLKPFINENLSETAKAKNEFWKALSADRKFQRVIEKIAGPVLNGIVSLTTGFMVK